jgi:hypothetical protein
MTPISVPAVPAANARTPAPASARGAPKRTEHPRAAPVDEQLDAPEDFEDPYPTEVAPPEEPPAPRGPSLFTRVLLWVFARPKKWAADASEAHRTSTAHARWRRYSIGCYALIVAVTLAGQLYSANPLGVYVKVQRVDIPRSTLILVRNDSRSAWRHVRIRLNGIFAHFRDEVAAGESVPLDLDKAFAITDGTGRVLRRPPKDLPIESLTLDCDSGHYETELK